MEAFKAHEEKMKAFQEAKRKGSKPPLGSQSANVPTQATERGEGEKLQHKPPLLKKSTKRMSSKDVTQPAPQSSKSTTAGTNETAPQNLDSGDENTQQSHPPLIIENETGERGAQPDSNTLLDTESNLIK